MIFQNIEVKEGMRDCVPVLLAVLPFGGVFGALAVENGLSFSEMLLTSLTIYAGASQYAMLDLLGKQVPAWLIVLTVFAINFRHVLYSASIGRKFTAFSFFQKALGFFVLVDPQYAVAAQRAKARVLTPTYYFSYAAVLFVVWMGSNIIGGILGHWIGDLSVFGFDFILPLYFTGLVFGFRSTAMFWPILAISSLVSLLIYYHFGGPWHITGGGVAGLLLAAFLAPSKGDEAKGQSAKEGQDAKGQYAKGGQGDE